MTNEHEATRTLVKSPPELWAECSQASSLTRHLSGSFGEIRITRLEPETAVAWEGEQASGTVRIEPSGWGTRVTLTATTVAEEPDPEPPAPEPPEPDPEPPMPGPEVVDERLAEAPSAEADSPAADAELGREEDELVSVQAEAEPEPTWPRRRGRLMARVRTFFNPPAPELVVTAPDPAHDATTPDGEGASDSAAVAPAAEAEPPPPEARPAAEVKAPSPKAEAPAPEPEPEPEALALEPAAPEPPDEPHSPSLDADAILTAALDSLGQAHHRPFSRA
jgi:hypothetical protein